MRTLLLFLALSLPLPAAVIMTQPQRYYFQASDSPFYPLFRPNPRELADAYLYGFEGNRPLDLRWEFAEIRRTGSPTFGRENASVDGDDGVVDGFDNDRRGITDDGLNETPSMDFYFQNQQHAGFPLWFGFVVTHPAVMFDGSPGPTDVELLGVGGNTLARFSLYDVMAEIIDSVQVGEDAEFYRTRNDRLVVFHSDDPIARVKIYYPTLIDHVQFGYTRVYVPEPGAATLGLMTAALLARRRR